MKTSTGGSKARISIILLSLSLAAGGQKCEQYNRAAISHDGTWIAFSLGQKWFETDKTSEIYRFNVDNCTLERLTLNNECDAWVDLRGADPVWVRGEKVGGVMVGQRGPLDETALAPGTLGNAPLWLGEDRVFFSILGADKEGQVGRDRGWFVLFQPGGLERLADFPMTKEEHLISTIPAFGGGRMYFAVARRTVLTPDEPGEAARGLLAVAVEELDLETKARRRVTSFYFPAEPGMDMREDLPAGWLDLALSPDGGTLICCFLPGKGFSIETFPHHLRSRVYLVDVKTGGQKLFSDRINMYYPQWVPAASADATGPAATRPASASAPTASRPTEPPRFMYLSGTGFEAGRGVWITDLDGRRLELAKLPDKAMQGYTGWTPLGPRRVRIFHIGPSGLVLIDVDYDGRNKVTRTLSRNGLEQLKARADLAAVIGRLARERDLAASVLALEGDNDTAAALHIELSRALAELNKRFGKLAAEPVTYTVTGP